MDLSPAATLAIFAVAAVLLYAALWWFTRGLPGVPKVIARTTVALILLLPLGLGLFFGAQMRSGDMAAPETMTESEQADRDGQGEVRTAKKPAPKRAARPRIGAPSGAPPASQPTEPPAGSDGFGTGQPRVAVDPAPTAPSSLPPPGTAEPARPDQPAAQPPAAANGGSHSPPPAGAAPSESADWDVVPVFYGTDRTRSSESQRIDYDTGRGKRLQLGHVLVTVPKSHQVPEVERPWVYHLPFTQIVIWREAEDPKKHFTIKDIREVGELEFLELVRKRLMESVNYKDHALVFVHGFNTSFEFAVFRTAQMAYDLKFDGAPFMYSWPSKGELGVQDYSYDRESAGAAEPYFRKFLELVARETGAKSVSVIAHSMGNQLLLPVLRDLRRSAPEGVRISQVILAAPDVDRDAFEFLASEIQGISNGVTLLAASNDRALTASRQFWGGVPRAGDVPADGPIVVPGIDTIDVTAINTDMFSLNHSGYAEKTELLNDIQLLIQTGERPPEKRIPILEKIMTAKGAFWRYPAIR